MSDARSASAVRQPSSTVTWLCCMVLIAAGVLRIASTHRLYTETIDEGYHLAAGMEWLTHGRYHYQMQHPPLSHVAAALLPYWNGVRSQGVTQINQEGTAILHSRNRYWDDLAAARTGILIFYIGGCILVCAWGLRWFDPLTALAAVLIFSMIPSVLAHAGLVTTDMACATGVLFALFAFLVWVEKPGVHTALFLGIGLAAAVDSKFSSLLFIASSVFTLGLVVVLTGRVPLTILLRALNERKWQLLLALTTAFLIIWSMYRFSLGAIVPNSGQHSSLNRLPAAMRETVSRLIEVRVPLSEMVKGLQFIKDHNLAGLGLFSAYPNRRLFDIKDALEETNR